MKSMLTLKRGFALLTVILLFVVGVTYAASQIQREDIGGSFVVGSVLTPQETILLYSELGPSTSGLVELDFGTGDLDAFGFFLGDPRVPFWAQNGGAVPFDLTVQATDVSVNGEPATGDILVLLMGPAGGEMLPAPDNAITIGTGDTPVALEAELAFLGTPAELGIDTGDSITFTALFTGERLFEVPPTPPPDLELPITRDLLPALVLIEEDIDSRFPTLVMNDSETGFQDNDSVANSLLLPDDDAEDLAVLGRLDGYGVTFDDPGGLFSVQSSVDQFDSNDSAIGFLDHQIDVLVTLVGVEVQPGVTIDDFQEIELSDLGEPTIAYLVVATFSDFEPPLVANFTFVSWVRENAVANAGIVGFTPEDRTEDVDFLATEMNLRITKALFELIEVTPIPPTPTSLPTAAALLKAEKRATTERSDLTVVYPNNTRLMWESRFDRRVRVNIMFFDP